MAIDKEKLNRSIYALIISKGLKATTMDSVASTLGMSKRTLYEVYADKKDMVYQVMRQHMGHVKEETDRLFNDSPNVMVALKRIFNFQAEEMSRLNIDFLRDMERYPDMRTRMQKERREENHSKIMQDVISRGIEQGVFSPHVNYELQVSLVSVQMEALKRMEELLPKGLTLADAYTGITTSFLRSIATPKGLEIIIDMENN